MQQPTSSSEQFFVTLNTSLAQVAAANCDCCRKSHMKCDRLLPMCSNCRARQRECSYSNKRAKSRKSKNSEQELTSTAKKRRKLSAEEQTAESRNVTPNEIEKKNETDFLDMIEKDCLEFFTSTFYEWVGFDVHYPILLADRMKIILHAQIEFIKELDCSKELDQNQTLFAQFKEHKQFMQLNYNIELNCDLEQLKYTSDSRLSTLLPSVLYLCHQHIRHAFAESLYKNIELKQIHLSELALLFSMESILCFHLGFKDISRKLFDKTVPIINFIWPKITADLNATSMHAFQMITAAILFVSHPLIDLQIAQFLPQFSNCCDMYFVRYQEFSDKGGKFFMLPENLQRTHSALCVIFAFFNTRVFINYLFSCSNHEETMATYKNVTNEMLQYLKQTTQVDIKTKFTFEVKDPRLLNVNHKLEFTALFLEFLKAVYLILQQENYASIESTENCLVNISSHFANYSTYLTTLKEQMFQVVTNQQQTALSYTLLFKGLELQLLIAFREEFLRHQCSSNVEGMTQIFQKITDKIYQVADHLTNNCDDPEFLFCFYGAYYPISSATQIHIERVTIQKSLSQNIAKEKEVLKKDLQSLELYMLRRFDKVQTLRFLHSKILSCLS